MSLSATRLQRKERWSRERAEEVVGSLPGVASVVVTERSPGDVEEIQVLGGPTCVPVLLVKDIESALFVHFGEAVDPRKIAVTQLRSDAGRATGPGGPDGPGGTDASLRMLLVNHRVVGEPSGRVSVVVTVEWQGRRFRGHAVGADVAQSRLEALATATLRAVEAAAEGRSEGTSSTTFSLHLDGVMLVGGVSASPLLLVSVQALGDGGEVTSLAGAVTVDGSRTRAAILATLQATDRWVRGQLTHPNSTRLEREEEGPLDLP